MPRPSARFKNVLVMTPAGAGGYNHTRGLRAYCDNLYLFDYEEPLRRRGVAELRERLALLIAENEIDVFVVSIYGDNYLLAPEFLAELGKSTRIVLWCWDDEANFALHSRFYAQAADAVVTTDFFSVAAYEALGIPAVLCFGNVSPDKLPVRDIPRDIDVSFVGHCGKADRPRYLAFLAEHGVKVRTFGFGSENGFISDDEMSRVFSRSKINLSFSRLEEGSARGTGHKLRTIEPLMTRSFCLAELYPALPRLYEPGVEIETFTDSTSLLEKIRFYLSHDEEREKIARLGYARTLREHADGPCFSRVMDELAAALARPARRAAIGRSPRFERRRIGGLMVHAASLARRGLIAPAAAVLPELFQYGLGAFFGGAAEGAARGAEILRRKLV